MSPVDKKAPDYAGHSEAHTRGPWEVRNGCNVFATNEDGTLEYLAVTGGLSGRDTIDRDAANARLIAAAPELLAALRMAVRHGDTNYCNPWVARALAALAKAEAAPMTYRQQPNGKYDIYDGDRRLATVHTFELAAQVCREAARRDAKAAAEWAVRS